MLALARHAIASKLGLEKGEEPAPTPRLLEPGACFVTLMRFDKLRGCIGSLEARQPLWDEIRDMARAAAFEDSRFTPVYAKELGDVSVEISVLSAPVPFPVKNEKDLYARLRPGIDGLVLEDGQRRSTFLPSVWEQLEDPREFVDNLKMKAGLPPDHWTKTLKFSRYEVAEIRE